MQDVAAREADGADIVDRGLGDLSKPVMCARRVAMPAHAADLFVVMRVAVGDDVEPGGFLRAQEDRDRVLVLLAVARMDHGFEEALGPQHPVYQAGRGSEPMIEVGSVTPADALYISVPPNGCCLSVAGGWSARQAGGANSPENDRGDRLLNIGG